MFLRPFKFISSGHLTSEGKRQFFFENLRKQSRERMQRCIQLYLAQDDAQVLKGLQLIVDSLEKLRRESAGSVCAHIIGGFAGLLGRK